MTLAELTRRQASAMLEEVRRMVPRDGVSLTSVERHGQESASARIRTSGPVPGSVAVIDFEIDPYSAEMSVVRSYVLHDLGGFSAAVEMLAYDVTHTRAESVADVRLSSFVYLESSERQDGVYLLGSITMSSEFATAYETMIDGDEDELVGLLTSKWWQEGLEYAVYDGTGASVVLLSVQKLDVLLDAVARSGTPVR
ncbi:MAG: hypothetical protein AAFR38_07385 [Planctomycetota bacterium]